jgi:hypothetical protein
VVVVKARSSGSIFLSMAVGHSQTLTEIFLQEKYVLRDIKGTCFMGWILLICLIVFVLVCLFLDETGLDWTDFLPF